METHDLARLLQHALDHDIPITRALGAHVAEYDGASLTLRAPLLANVNHAQTAFAGSLNALATLACWGMLWLVLYEAREHAQVVIQDSVIRYLEPVASDFCAICLRPDQRRIEQGLAGLRAKGRARIEFESRIFIARPHDTGEGAAPAPAVEFRGRYVAQRAEAGVNPPWLAR